MNSGIITPSGLNLGLNPLDHKPGQMIRAINISIDQFNAVKKRPGYNTYLGTVDGGAVLDLHNFTLDNGTQFWNYRNNNGTLFYSQQGTGSWTVCGNGTFTAGSHIGVGTLENTLIVGDGVAATRHTTNGTSFTDTTAAPVASRFVDFQQRIYAMGTSSTLFWSTTGTPTSWTGSDSSSVQIPGGGKLLDVMKVANNVVTTKNSGIMHRWDGYNLYDLSTNLAFTSPYSVANVEDYRFGLNRVGQFGFGGNKPEIISNPIEKLIYNDAGEGIIGTTFDNAPGVAHKYEYMLSIGTVTDDLTDETIPNAITVYDYQADDWSIRTFANRPTSWLSYKDASGSQQLIFGDSTGQCYTYGNNNLNDNGQPIECIMEGIITGNSLQDKKWNEFSIMMNPGCQAQVQIAISNTFTKGKKNWINIGGAEDGAVNFKFPSGSRGKFLFWKIIESSRNSRLHLYGLEFDAEIIKH